MSAFSGLFPRSGGSHLKRRPRGLVIITIAAISVLTTRGLMMLDNPDWGPILDDSFCGLLSAPVVHENIRVHSPDLHIPLSDIDPSQMAQHYHLGSRFLYYTVALLYRWTGVQSLVLVKVLGTALTTFFAVVLAWALARLFRRQWLPVVVPLFLVAVPPSLFLWVSLLPRGHYFEHHFFYALFIPFMLLAVSGRLSWWTALLLGALSGAAIAYAASNALFPAAIAVLFLRDLARRSPDRPMSLGSAFTCFASGAVACVLVFSALARSSALGTRLRDAMTGNIGIFEAVGQNSEARFMPLRFCERLFDIVAEHLFAFCMPFTHELGQRLSLGNTLAAIGLATIFMLGAARLVFALVTCPAPSSRTRRTALHPYPVRVHRFLALNGALLLGTVIAYVVMGPQWATDTYRELAFWYLVPIYPPLFVGAGALFATSSEQRGIRQLVAVVVVLAVAAVSLAWGLWANYEHNATRRDRPDQAQCDAKYLGAYFWRGYVDAGQAAPERAERPIQLIADFDGGVRVCEASMPGSGEACRLAGYISLLAEQGSGIDGIGFVQSGYDCDSAPPGDRTICARALGATRGSCVQSLEHTNHELCSRFDGDAYSACISGAWQGSFNRSVPGDCFQYLTELCLAAFEAPHALASCLEQTSSLIYGMPDLPPASEGRHDGCAAWPQAWRGLCQRAHQLAREPCGELDEDCCEDIYVDRYLRDHP